MITLQLNAQQAELVATVIRNAERQLSGIIGAPVTLSSTTHYFEDAKTETESINEVIKLVAREYSVSIDTITGKSNQAYKVHIRQMFWVICRNVLRANYKQIAEISNRDHSTVVYGVQRMMGIINVNADTRKEYIKLTNIVKKIT